MLDGSREVRPGELRQSRLFFIHSSQPLMADWHLRGVGGGEGTRYRKQSLFPVNGVKAFVQMCATAQLGGETRNEPGRGTGGGPVCESVEEPVRPGSTSAGSYLNTDDGGPGLQHKSKPPRLANTHALTRRVALVPTSVPPE